MVTITEYQQKLSFVVGDMFVKVAVRERSLFSGYRKIKISAGTFLNVPSRPLRHC